MSVNAATALSPTPKADWVGQVLEYIDTRGIPAPWQEFGTRLSEDASLSTQIVSQVKLLRDGRGNCSLVYDLYNSKLLNLQAARRIISETMTQYDIDGTWLGLDTTLTRIDLNEFDSEISKTLAVHPFPIVMESLRFNWNYMRTNGVRAFYSMSDTYLKQIQETTIESQKAFSAEQRARENGDHNYRHLWLIMSDLGSIEVPTHCDVCRISIAPILIPHMLGL